MNRVNSVISILVMCVLCVSCKTHSSNVNHTDFEGDAFSASAEVAVEDSIPLGAKLLLEAYPESVKAYADNTIILKNGVSIVFDDGEEKSIVEAMDKADIEDMFSTAYSFDSIPQYMCDAGRCRCESLFMAMYGNDEKEVRNSLVKVDWFGQRIWMTKVNGVNIQLEAVAEELKGFPEYHRYLDRSSTFNWRKIKGTDRLSAHSFGIAIDINVPMSDYWVWAFKTTDEEQKIGYVNRIPLGLVEIFEKHGFIWGGRWYHFDTMHFEYRPEIIANSDISK